MSLVTSGSRWRARLVFAALAVASVTAGAIAGCGIDDAGSLVLDGDAGEEVSAQLPESLSWRAEQALARAGCQRVVPDGEPFDAAAHDTLGADRTVDPMMVDRVSRTLRPGYRDGKDLIVRPQVAVFAPFSDDEDSPAEGAT